MDMPTQQELGHLIRVSWIVLIPVGVLLSLVLYKLAMLLHSLLDLMTLARYELTPAFKDLRLTAENVEILSTKAVASVKSVEHGVSAVVPAVKSAGSGIRNGAASVWNGIWQSFGRKA